MAFSTEYCIPAGEFARICGTTRDTLRYYHKQGILVPQRNAANGYHYYSYAQVASFYFIATLRGLDCSAADIREYLLAGEQARFDSFMAGQYQKLLAQRAALEQKIALLSGSLQLLEEIRAADAGGPVVQTWSREAALRLTPVLSRPARSFREIAPDVQRHIAACEAVGATPYPMGVSMDAAGFLAGDYAYRQVFSFAPLSVAAGAEGGAEPLPGRRVAAAVCRDSDGDITAVYRRLADFIRARGLRPRSDVYSLSLVNVIDPTAARRYLKYLFVCVAE